MADVKISALTAVVTPATSDVVPVVQGGVTKQETVAQIRTVIMPVVLTADVSGSLPKTNQDAQDMAGDVTGTTAASVVAKVNGIAISGTPAIGNQPVATSTSAAAWASLNLAGGAGYVTGQLPTANVATTLTGKTLTTATIVAASNTITDTSAATGDLLRFDGTRFARFARGTANQVLTTNGGGTDIAWSAAGSGSPGGSTTQVQYNNAGAFAGDAGMTYDAATDILSVVGALSLGAAAASAGDVRFSVGGAVTAHDSGAGYYTLIQGSGDSVYVGTNAAFAQQASGINIYSAGATALGVGATTCLYVTGAGTEAWLPLTGSSTGSSPYAVHGAITYAFAANANYTVTGAEYMFDWISFNVGAWSAGRTVTFPSPATLAAAYTKTIHNNTGFTMTISNGGTTKTLATGLAQRFLFGVAAVSFASPTWTP